MSQLQVSEIDFFSDTYRDTYSRINGIVIEGEQQAHDNFVRLAELLPDNKEYLIQLARIEARHKKSFQACGENLDVTPDLEFARNFFADLHQSFEAAADAKQIVTCLVIQSLIIECFAIAAYNVYIPVADDFAKKITKVVVQDEYSHLNFGEAWLKEHFQASKDEIETANRQVLPLIWRMLNQVESDAKVLGMEKSALVEGFLSHYGESLHNIGFSTPYILRMSAASLTN